MSALSFQNVWVEYGDKIVLDVARLDHIWRDSMMDFPNPQFWRFTIDTTTVTQEEQVERIVALAKATRDRLRGH